MSLRPQVCKKDYKVHIPTLGENCDFWLVPVVDVDSIKNPDKDHAYWTDNDELYIYDGFSLQLASFKPVYATRDDIDEFIHVINPQEPGVATNNYDDLQNKPSINSVELKGNKTTQDLHIYEKITEQEIDEMF